MVFDDTVSQVLFLTLGIWSYKRAPQNESTLCCSWKAEFDEVEEEEVLDKLLQSHVEEVSTENLQQFVAEEQVEGRKKSNKSP